MSSNESNAPERNVAGANFVFFGGSTGIGRATAIELAKRGASVLIVGRSAQAGAKVVADAKAAGAASADFLQADLSTVKGIKAAADGVAAWKPALHGVMHTAMAALNKKELTEDKFEFAFALQYFARAALNRLLLDRLAASGDGRIVQVAGDMPKFLKVNIEDPNFEHKKWSFFGAIMNTHLLGYLHVQEAARLWADKPVTLSLTCVGSTKTKAMQDPEMPLSMRLMAAFGTTPEVSAKNAVALFTRADVKSANGTNLRDPKSFTPTKLTMNAEDAASAWKMTSDLAAQHGLTLP